MFNRMMKTLTIGDIKYEIVDEQSRDNIKKSKVFVTPEMYGAVGDGITDDVKAIQNAINSGYVVYFRDATYLISEPIIINRSNTHIQSFGEIVYSGKDYAVILEKCEHCNLYFNKITARNGSGLKLYSNDRRMCAYHNITVGKITANNTGICTFAEYGNQYNEIKFDMILADVCIDIQCGANGWNNENKWYGGHMGGVGKYATYAIKAINSNNGDVNAHRFYNVGFEGVVDGCVLENVAYFVFENPRTSESIENKVFILKSCVRGCIFRLAHCYLKWIDYSQHTGDSRGWYADGNTFSGVFLADGGSVYDFSYFEIWAGKMYNCNQKIYGYWNIWNKDDNVMTLDTAVSRSAIPQELLVHGDIGCVLDTRYYHSGNINTIYACMNGGDDSTGVISDSDGRIIARIADYPWQKIRITALGSPSNIFDLAPNGWVVEVIDDKVQSGVGILDVTIREV